MLGERIRTLRLEKGLTQEELGKVLGVGKTTVCQYENETRKPDPNMLRKIAEFFRVPVDYLLGLTDIRTPYYILAAHRKDDPLHKLPEEARRSLEEFQEYLLRKYGKKTE